MRMYTLDLFKLVLAYVIAFFHVGTHIAPGSTAAVQIFFVISGFFLGKKFYSQQHTNYSAWQYTLDHVRGLYPHYLFSQLALLAYLTARAAYYLLLSPSWDALGALIKSFYSQIPDLLLVQSAYTSYPSINYPLWQLSALLIAGYFVFALLRWDEPLSRRILFPGAILMLLSLLDTGVALDGNYGVIFMPLFRAFGPLCLGVLTWYFTTTEYYETLRKHKLLLNLSGVVGLVGIFAYETYYNIFLLGTMAVLLSCCYADSWINRLFNHRCFRHCGKLSYAIYLNQALIERFVCAQLFPHQELGNMGNMVFFLLLTLYSVITMVLVDRLMAWLRIRKDPK